MMEKTFLAALLSRPELYHLGIKPDRIVKQMPKVIESSKETMNAMEAAEDMMVIRLKDRQARIEKQVQESEKKLNNNTLSDKTKAELTDAIELLQLRKQETNNLLARSDKSSLENSSKVRKDLQANYWMRTE